MNTTLRSSWLIGSWATTMAIVVAVSIASGANLSTTALLLAFGIAPAIVMALLARGEASPSVAQILHSVEAKDRRS